MAAAARTPSEPKSTNERRRRLRDDGCSKIGPKVTGTGVINGLGVVHGGEMPVGEASGVGDCGAESTGNAVESIATFVGGSAPGAAPSSLGVATTTPSTRGSDRASR